MNIIKNWFNTRDHLEMVVEYDGTIHRIIKTVKTDNLPKEIEIGINLAHSNHYVTPTLVHQGKDVDTYVLSYHNGINTFNELAYTLYSDEMKEAHSDAIKAGYQPVFGFEDVTTNEKDEIVVINVNKFK